MFCLIKSVDTPVFLHILCADLCALCANVSCQEEAAEDGKDGAKVEEES